MHCAMRAFPLLPCTEMPDRTPARKLCRQLREKGTRRARAFLADREVDERRSTNCRLSVTDLKKKKDFPSRRTPSKQIAESGRSTLYKPSAVVHGVENASY